jgi:hypothetical protein
MHDGSARLVVGFLCLWGACAAHAADPSSDVAAPPPAAPTIVLAPIVGVESKKAAASQKALLASLTERLGPRVVTALAPATPSSPAAATAAEAGAVAKLAALAEAVEAERAIVVEVQPLLTVVRVYGALDDTPPLRIELPRKKGAALDKKWAAAVADAVALQATELLAARPEAPVVDLSEPETTAAEPSPAPVKTPPSSASSSSSSSLPRAVATIGGGVALRSLELSGSQKDAVAPMELGPLPSVSAFVALRPLAFLDARAWWNDLLVEAFGRRAVIAAQAGGASCAVDDDELTAAVSWRARLSDNPLIPRVGGGVSAGAERFVVGACGVPALSVSSLQTAAFGRLAWRPLPSLLEVDVLGGARLPIVPEGTLVERPGFLGQLAVAVTPLPMLPWVVVRGVARAHETRLSKGSAGALGVGDVRASFELQVGGAL